MHIWWKVDNWSCAEDDVAIGATEDQISPACLEEEAYPFPICQRASLRSSCVQEGAAASSLSTAGKAMIDSLYLVVYQTPRCMVWTRLPMVVVQRGMGLDSLRSVRLSSARIGPYVWRYAFGVCLAPLSQWMEVDS